MPWPALQPGDAGRDLAGKKHRRRAADGGGRGGRVTQGGSGAASSTTTPTGNDGFTKVVRNKSKYNKNKVEVEQQAPQAPRVRGSRQKSDLTSA